MSKLKKVKATPNLKAVDANNPPLFSIQALEQAFRAGQLVRRIDWPEGRFLIANEVGADTDWDTAAFSIMEHGSNEIEDFQATVADWTIKWERFIPPVVEGI